MGRQIFEPQGMVAGSQRAQYATSLGRRSDSRLGRLIHADRDEVRHGRAVLVEQGQGPIASAGEGAGCFNQAMEEAPQIVRLSRNLLDTLDEELQGFGLFLKDVGGGLSCGLLRLEGLNHSGKLCLQQADRIGTIPVLRDDHRLPSFNLLGRAGQGSQRLQDVTAGLLPNHRES